MIDGFLISALVRWKGESRDEIRYLTSYSQFGNPPLRLPCPEMYDTCQKPLRRKLAVSAVSSANRFLKSSNNNGSSGPFVFDVASLSPEARNHYGYLSPEEKADYEKSSQSLDKLMKSPEVESNLKGVAGEAIHEVVTQVRTAKFQPPRLKLGFFSMEDPVATGEDEEFEGDDITSLAHGDLEQHRELREYARIAAWEMPLLSSPSSFALPLAYTLH